MAADTAGVAVAVLAAGRGERLVAAAPKPLVEWRGRPLVAWALDAAVASGLRPVLLVTGYRAVEVGAVVPPGVDVVDNPDWQQGIASSLRAALAALEPFAQVEAVCIGLADQPRVDAEAYRRLAAAHRGGAPFVVATYEGRRQNPVLLARSLWPRAAALEGDEGARVLMRSLPVVEVPCDDTGTAADVDTWDDLAALEAAAPPPSRCRPAARTPTPGQERR